MVTQPVKKHSSKITPINAKATKNEQVYLAAIQQIRAGLIAEENIEQALQSVKLEDWQEVIKGLYEGFNEQGLEGFAKVYRALQVDRDNLRRWHNTIFQIPTYAGKLLSDVKPEKIDWLWKPRLALGKIAALDGDPGLGKSILTLDLIARITTGRAMPDGTRGIKGGAVLITPEDGLADTIVPRLARAGADLTRVSSLSTITETLEDGTEYERGFTLCASDLRLLEQEIERVDAKIVVIDPIMAIMGGKDTYKDNDVRAALAPLQAIIEKYHTACIMVRHLTKTRGDNPLMAGGGSIAFIGVARTGMIVVKDAVNDCLVFAHVKSNIKNLGESLTYTITNDEEIAGDDRPYIVWGESTEANVSDLINPVSQSKNTGGNRQKILDFLEGKKPEEATIPEIAEAVPDMTLENLKMTLGRMYKKGEIDKSERGLYHAK